MVMFYHMLLLGSCFFSKHKTADEIRMSDWSSDVCFSELVARVGQPIVPLDRLAVDLGFEDVGFAFLALPDHVRTPCMKAGPGWIGCRRPAYSESPGHASPVSSAGWSAILA